MSIDSLFKRTKQDAFKDFSYFDSDTTFVDPSIPTPLQPLTVTSAIVLIGYIPADAIRFSVNLLCKTSDNIALHFNPRLDRGYVVRNTKLRGTWELEEACSPAGPCNCSFQRNNYIHLLIFCSDNEFQIAVNGEHFCAFAYRFPLQDITGLECNGHIEDVRIRQLNLSVYPDPSVYTPPRSLILTVDQPLVEYLEVPISVSIGSEFKIGSRLFIKGRLKLLPHSFYINLQKGNTIYPHPIVVLHLNPRFLYGTSAPCVVMNYWCDGSWKDEERHQGQLSWMPGRDFLLTIRCEHESYTIWLGNKMISEFKHRLPSTLVDTIRISGDIVIHHLSMGYS